MSKVKRYIVKLIVAALRFFIKPLVWGKVRLIRYLLRLRAKLQISSLKEAIHDADKDKEKTGRKNMVVFNTTSGKYEPVQKKLLKAATRVGKNKSNKALTEGRKRMLKQTRERAFTNERVKQIEKKSLYVTN
jgi:hypothetical protein